MEALGVPKQEGSKQTESEKVLPLAVGQLAAQCALFRGARKVWMIDNVEYRLQHAKATVCCSY